MKIKSLLVCGSMAVLGAAFTSCSKDIAFDSEGATQRLYAEYEANFVKKYGAIDPNQTWDFASMRPVRTLPSTNALTRAEGDNIQIKLEEQGTITINSDIIKWMRKYMKAGEDHSQMGAPFASVLSRNSFIIAPFYQGQASYFWELWVNIGGQEYKIWEKYDKLKYITSDGQSHDLTTSGVPNNAVQVVAPTFKYTATKDASLFFFLKVWKGGDTAHTSDGSGSIKLSSLDNGNMRALEKVPGLPMPAGVPDDYFAYIIGCEDNEDSGSDSDFEDLAFLFFGPPLKEVEEVEVRQTKRYMMEDLGATDDFDFNDVVVDVSNVSKKKITRKENFSTGHMDVFEEDIPNSHYQEAIVRAAGGTLDFTLEIGSTSWNKSDKYSITDMLNTGWHGETIYYTGDESVLARFPITNDDWDPSTNNIKVTVYKKDGNGVSEDVKTIKFPKKGEAPMIIAVEPDVEWMVERNGVPQNWIKQPGEE